ncbi:MAG: hypothetical protein AAFV26_08590 [Pseudomonadota bacterium]
MPTPPHAAGLILIALIMLIIGWIALRKQPRPIKLFAVALCIVGLGYLATTNVPLDMVRLVFGEQV